MKKLSKKQKLIGSIAIILVAVILAIVITTNIISNNNQSNQLASQEDYLATTANAGSTLVASYIKKGITIGGITGTLETLDTSDATATPCDIAKGKTAYVNGEKITGRYIVYESTLGTVTGNETSNTTVNDIYGNKVVVPAGFKIVNPNQNVPDGIVIEDVNAGDNNTKGSQFVWIPIGNVYYDTCENYETITLGRYDFNSDGSTTTVSGLYTEDTAKSHNSRYGNAIAKDINDFIEKANSSGGYYIGRYEAGDATATSSARTSSTSDTNPIVSKAGVYPYNYITQPQASSLCQNMYSSSNFESDLINSYAWDTAIVFIQEFSEDKDYSRQAGKNTKLALQKCGESILDYNLDEGDEAQDKRCNIFDMAGNSKEWSTETYSNTVSPCTTRGGYGTSGNIVNYTSARHSYLTRDSFSSNSPRPTLYL